MDDQPDMFGHDPAQAEIFDDLVAEPPKKLTAEDIRSEMLALIAAARAAETMPWTPREVRSHTALFPYMAEWLSKEEGEQLLLAFETEMERLRRAA
jgi:hypothetical protein